MITVDNYEEYLSMYVDGELLPQQEAELMVFLDGHPHLKDELAGYELTRLVPDEELVYAGKESLLQPLPAKRIAFMPMWRAIGIAAGIAAVIVVSIYALHDGIGANTPMVADNNKGIKHSAPSPVTDIDTTSHQNVAVNSTAIAPTDSTHTIPQVIPTNVVVHRAQQGSKTTSNNMAVAAYQIKEDGIESGHRSPTAIDLVPLTASVFEKLPVDTSDFSDVVAIDLSNYQFMPKPLPVKRAWIEKLPIVDEKKDMLNTMANSVAAEADKVGDLKNTFSDKRLTIKVEKRKLILSF